MTAKEFRSLVEGKIFKDSDGEDIEIVFGPPLAEAEIRKVEESLSRPLPADAKEMMRTFSTCDDTPEIDAHGSPFFGAAPLVPHSYNFGPDGLGNCCIVDLDSSSPTDSNILWLCNDPPLLARHCFGFNRFWDISYDGLLLKSAGHERGEIDMEIYRAGYPFPTSTELRSSADPLLCEFANSVSPNFLIADLRKDDPRTGINVERIEQDAFIRFNDHLIFAFPVPVEKKRLNFIAKLLGRKQ